MSRAKKTPPLVWHCTAGFSGVEAIESFWHRPKAQGGLAWFAKGYVAIIELDGTIWWLWDNTNKVGGYKKVFNPKAFEFITNGVLGFNEDIVNVATIGGVENIGTPQKPNWKAKDTRTPEQKASQLVVTDLYFKWLSDNGGDVTKAMARGHRDYSKDKNGNGVIDANERNKECPSYDVWTEFRWLFQTAINKFKLPNP